MNKVPTPIFSFREDLPHLDFFFTKQSNLTTNFPLHTHDYFEMEIIISGNAETVLNGSPLHLSRGSAHILSPADVHNLTITRPLEIYKIMLLADWVSEETLYKLMDNLGTVHFSEDELNDIIPILNLLLKESKENLKDHQSIINNLLSCIIIFFERKQKINSQIQLNNVALNSHIQKAISYTLLNYINNISSNDVAKFVNLNPVYFSTLFHETTGVTFINYLNDLRLTRARQLLLLGSYSVSEVCYACGFNSSSNFLRAFKKKYNCSPNELKSRNESDSE